MAKVQKKNLRLSNLFDEFERKMFLLKLNYEKYFSGIERIEPLKEREDTRRFLRDLMQEPMTNTMQKVDPREFRSNHVLGGHPVRSTIDDDKIHGLCSNFPVEHTKSKKENNVNDHGLHVQGK